MPLNGGKIGIINQPSKTATSGYFNIRDVQLYSTADPTEYPGVEIDPNQLFYLVVAGGGGGGQGETSSGAVNERGAGGGAGGLRTNFGSTSGGGASAENSGNPITNFTGITYMKVQG